MKERKNERKKKEKEVTYIYKRTTFILGKQTPETEKKEEKKDRIGKRKRKKKRSLKPK